MNSNWSFGQKLGAGFAVVILMTVIVSAVGIYNLRKVTNEYDRLTTLDFPLLLNAEELNSASELRSSIARGYLLTAEDSFLVDIQEARDEFGRIIERLKQNLATEESRNLIDEIERSEAAYQTAIDQAIALRKNSASTESASLYFSDQVLPKRIALRDQVERYADRQQQFLNDSRTAVQGQADFARNLMLFISTLVSVLACIFAYMLAKGLSSQIGTVVGQVQSSSAELQAAASQQASGTKEQTTAMNEIATTISELLATSHQIAESAQRVAGIADETSRSARSGEGTVEKTNETILSIKRQVDLIVNHMLDLGKKSQEIGTILDIVTELADQTNILSINATIEAVGAGESGKRFGVVAEEIRKLADRVGESTKDIRRLIEDVRSSVNTTIMATESGSKTVDAGSRQFTDVAMSFKHIAGLVSTTTEAAREIELSTKQQSTAVEQVNVAISNVAQATQETEASSSQTLQTASQLASLSRDLQRLIQSGNVA